MQISVSGEQRTSVAPERAELSITVSEEGTDRPAVVAKATAAANLLAGDLSALKESGAVERFSVEPLRTYAWRPKRTLERFTASVELSACFADFEALGRFAADAGERPGVGLGWVNWTLTDATADRLRDECIDGAVARARQRAEAMARAAGAGAIEIVEIADPGLLGDVGSMQDLAAAPMMASMKRRGARMADEGAEAVQIVPQDIEIGAQLQLRFTTT